MPENNNIVNVNIDIEPIREAVVARLEQEIQRLEENMGYRQLTEEELPEATEPVDPEEVLVTRDAGGVAGVYTGGTGYTGNVRFDTVNWGEPVRTRTPTYRCNGCEQEIEGYGYVSVRSQNVEICEPCSAQMFRWMVSRSKSAILNK